MSTKWEEIRIDKKIFKSTVLASAAVLILGVAFVMGILYQYFGKQLNSELERKPDIWLTE